MKRISTVCATVTTCICVLLGPTVSAVADINPHMPTVAFYYGTLPPSELHAYDWVVLDPDQATSKEVAALRASGVTTFAYLSLGEIEPRNLAWLGLTKEIAIARNHGWDSLVVNQLNPQWPQAVLERATPRIVSAGFDGLFLDTLDSFGLAPASERAAQRDALSLLIANIHNKFPQLKLFTNRGFEIYADNIEAISAVAVESLFGGWDAERKRYIEVTDADRQWLLDALRPMRERSLPVVAIDYVKPADQDRARDVAKKIAALDLIPWVSEPTLQRIGLSITTPLARRLLVLYRDDGAPLDQQPAHYMLGAIFDHLGYAVDYLSTTDALPEYLGSDRYAAVITWAAADNFADPLTFDRWMTKRLDDGVRLIAFGALPTENKTLLNRFGITTGVAPIPPFEIEVLKQSHGVGTFEAPLRLRRYEWPETVSLGSDNKSLLRLRVGEQISDPVVVGAWGGVVMEPYMQETGLNNRNRWIIDPFQFVQAALGKPLTIVPDTTTENGRRLLLTHIDGDGFVSLGEFPGSPYSAEVIRDEIVSKYDIPHTVSVIEGEVGPTGMYPDLSARLEDIARDLFKLPNVEVASHSFSHPFFWTQDQIKAQENLKYGVSLPIPNYSVDLKREVFGSIDYINTELAPADKRVEVFLWSGDAAPDGEALSYVQQAGVVNVNGGNTMARPKWRSMTSVYPMARPTSGGLQVYAPVMNENVFTNDWLGPYFGFRKARHTFEFTETPRRLKPINMYYHFYSGSKQASLTALRELYDWALQQETTPLYLSDYARRVQGFYSVNFAQRDNGGWQISNLGALRTLRIDPASGWPDLERSENIAGWRDVGGVRYLHLSNDQAVLYLTTKQPTILALASSNGVVRRWQLAANGSSAEIELQAWVPLEIEVHSAAQCTLNSEGVIVRSGEITPGLQSIRLKSRKSGKARLDCGGSSTQLAIIGH